MSCGKSVPRSPKSSPNTYATSLDLIRALRSGEISPQHISSEDRRRCVEYFTGEGLSVAEIASILKTSDRTIARDRSRIREDNAVAASPELLPQMVGRMMGEADLSIGRLRRLGRDKGTAAAVKVEAERSAWLITKELIQSLQRLGYLPIALSDTRGDQTPQPEDAPSYDTLLAEVERLESIREGCKVVDEGTRMKMDETKHMLARLSVGQQLRHIKTALTPVGKDKTHG